MKRLYIPLLLIFLAISFLWLKTPIVIWEKKKVVIRKVIESSALSSNFNSVKAKQAISIYDLSAAFLCLETSEEVELFLKDLCTPKEISDMKERWRVCQLLAQGDLSYRGIHALTGASLTTVGRVARFLREEPYKGYETILKRLKQRGAS